VLIAEDDGATAIVLPQAFELEGDAHSVQGVLNLAKHQIIHYQSSHQSSSRT
jgi:hypothetical protein